MGDNLTKKLLKDHLIEGTWDSEKEAVIKIDQVLTHDSSGTMAFLQFEAMNMPRIKVEQTVVYIDHNTLQLGFENSDDHRFLQGMAAKYGAYFSRAGNGICHQVHLERFGIPGETMLGSDSHTPTAGGLGMLAIGVGGLDVAVAMGGGGFYLTVPEVINIRLHGSLSPWVSAKDVILEILKRLTVKGGVGKILEYSGPGIKNLSIPERATITNMGAETGATTSIFPSDEVTKEFLKAQGREASWRQLEADPNATYIQTIDIDLGSLEPMVAKPHMPDNVVNISEIAGLAVDQVVIGSCTNSSYLDLMRAAAILKGKKIPPTMSLVIAPGSRQVLNLLMKNGVLNDFMDAGARILECACGPCIGTGQSPPSGSVSVRTVNRNFEGRSGTKDAQVYIVGTEAAAAAAIFGKLADPRKLGEFPKIIMPKNFEPDDSMIVPPSANPEKIKVIRGPNIKELPVAKPLAHSFSGEVLLKVGDDVTTDHIIPATTKAQSLRSNIPAMAKYAFEQVDPNFYDRAKDVGGGFIVGGANYGQGSSREHAALIPMYLGVKTILAKSFARIHRENLINFGIIPFVFINHEDYERIDKGDLLEFLDIRSSLEPERCIKVINKTKNHEYQLKTSLTFRQVEIIRAGGLLNYTKDKNNKNR